MRGEPELDEATDASARFGEEPPLVARSERSGDLRRPRRLAPTRAGTEDDGGTASGEGDAESEGRGSRRPGRRRSRRRRLAGAAGEAGVLEEPPEAEERAEDDRAEEGYDAEEPPERGRASEWPDLHDPGDEESRPVRATDSEPQRKRRRRGRGRRGAGAERTGVSEPSTEPERADERRTRDVPDAGDERPPKNKERRGRKRKSSDELSRGVHVELLPGEDDDLPELPELPDDVELLDGEEQGGRGKKRKRSRKKRGARESTGEEEDAPEPEEVPRTAQILVNAADSEEVRVAVVDDGRILDFQMTVRSESSLVSDIYRGRVVNIEPSIGAAFVDFGRGRNGFLHTSDVLPAYGDEDFSLTKLLSINVAAEESGSTMLSDEFGDAEGEESVEEEAGGKAGGKREGGGRGGGKGRRTRFRQRPRVPITDLLDVGDRVAVQVTKDAIGDKGPTLTTYLSIPGRYLVLMPSITHTGVSRKIDDVKERKRLKRILDSLSIPKGMGVIARTAAAGHTKAELKRDVDYLLGTWERFSKELGEGRGTRTLYQESDVAIRTVRDLFGPETESVVVDDPEVHKSIVEFTQRLMPEHVHRIKMHDGTRPLFHAAGIEQDFERIFARRIDLPSGGSIVFDQAEALVAIDVNSGKTRSDGFDFEEIALKTNLEAVPEIARQIRLRDLGGILVIDFIDMMKRSHMGQVERAFRDELAKDRARSKVGRISQFGLLEMTRQRLGPGMEKKVFMACPRCRGQGRVRTVESRAAAIVRRLGSALTLKGFSRVEIKAHPEVVDFLHRSRASDLDELRVQHGREIRLLPAPDQLEDSVVRYLRTDGREVRPGGRRKR